MPSQLPVPSKAALAALRGLVFGTSCTALVLITEDRRRRINVARTAVTNAKRLKSSQQYHAGGAVLALALEEEAILSQSLITWIARDGSTVHGKQGPSLTEPPPTISPPPAQRQGTDETERVTGLLVETNQGKARRRKAALGQTASPIPSPFMRLLPERSAPKARASPTNRASDRTTTSADAFNGSRLSLLAADVQFRITELCESRNPKDVEAALVLFHETLKTTSDPSAEEHKTLVRCSTALCQACIDLGHTEDAAGVLDWVVHSGPLDEDDYYRHDPLTIIDSILPPAEMSLSGHAAYIEKLDRAIDLFLPRFTTKPQIKQPRLVEVGRRLLDRAFAANHLIRADDIFWRIISQDDNLFGFVQWFITRLHEHHEYRSAVKHFLLCYVEANPSQESFGEVIDVVIDSVTAGHNYKVEQVWKAVMATDLHLEARWVGKLLRAHWQRYRDVERTTNLFDSLAEGRGVPDGSYRTIIEITLEAGNRLRAQQYFDYLIHKDVRYAADVRVLGHFALSKARLGDWDAVRQDFSAVNIMDPAARDAYGQVFVPVLKQFAKQHTLGETEEFLRSYIEDMGVPVSRYLVGLMAREYAAVRDIKSFIGWLEYCASAGFPIASAFSNAILTSCLTRWKFPFRDLKAVFLTLRCLNPSFADEYTERVMLRAAMAAQPRLARKNAVAARVASLSVPSSHIHPIGKCARDENILLAMSQAIGTSKPAYAVRIYKRAVHLGMRPGRGLRLAVLACLRRDGTRDSREAITLLRAAQESGEEVTVAVAPLLDAHLASVDLAGGGDAVFRKVRGVLQKFEDGGVQLSDFALNRAAIHCLRGGHFRGAVQFALAAAEASGCSAPCYNVFNFGVLLEAYTGLFDAKAIRAAVRIALASEYCVDRVCLRSLKRARQRLRKCAQTEDIVEAREAVERAVREIVERRAGHFAERTEVQGEVIRIMQQAAVDAGCEPVDLAELPWLAGGGRGGGVSHQTTDIGQNLQPQKEKLGEDDLFAWLHRGGGTAEMLEQPQGLVARG